MKQDNDENKVASCSLPPSGYTYTTCELHAWCGQQVQRIRELLNDKIIKTQLWTYRYTGHVFLALDFFGVDQSDSLTFICSGENNYLQSENDEIHVVDMAEALHAIGIIQKALNVESIQIGRYQNERNEAVVQRPFENGRIHGQINCWNQ